MVNVSDAMGIISHGSMMKLFESDKGYSLKNVRVGALLQGSIHLFKSDA
jgi:hypothetical protein